VFNNLEGFEVKMIMDNNAIPTSVLAGLESVGTYGIENQYPLNFEYEYSPKYKLSEYIRKLVIRTNEDTYLLDLYVPKHTDSFERLEKLFDNEINKVVEGKIKPLHLEFKTVSFMTQNAYGVEDMCEFKFECIKFVGISSFEGKNILTYEVKMLESGTKVTDKYRNEALRESYAKKEKRTTTLNLGNEEKEKHICDKCGKEVESNYDYRITKETIGVGVCKKCLEIINKKTK
jgi:hypothetical protein